MTVPLTVLQHLSSHDLFTCPQTNEQAVELLIGHEDNGCKECSAVLDRYIALTEAS